MGSFGDNAFPYPRFLKVPFVFVPKGAPRPLEWMAEHPGFVTFAATFVPRRQTTPPQDAVPEAEADTVVHGLDRSAHPSGRPDDDIRRVVPPARPLLSSPPDTRPAWLRRIVPPPAPR